MKNFFKFLAIASFTLSLNANTNVFTVETGAILNNQHAKNVCPIVCNNYIGNWTGKWQITMQGVSSICQCQNYIQSYESYNIIWNDYDAQRVCPEVIKRNGAIWNGKWMTKKTTNTSGNTKMFYGGQKSYCIGIKK